MNSDWHILVVEDEPDGAEVVSRILKFHRINHSVVNNGEDAYAYVAQNYPSAVIVDLMLPGMNGWQLLKAMRANSSTANIPAVAVTAFHSTSVAQEAIGAGFESYFPKPIEATSFVRELERILRG